MTLWDRRVLSESRVDPVLLATLLDDPDIWVRTETGSKENTTPPEVLTCLGVDPEPDVRAAAAGNANTPTPTLVTPSRRWAQRGTGTGRVEPDSPARGSGSRSPPTPTRRYGQPVGGNDLTPAGSIGLFRIFQRVPWLRPQFQKNVLENVSGGMNSNRESKGTRSRTIISIRTPYGYCVF